MLYSKEYDYHFQLLVHDLVFNVSPIYETYINNDDNPIVEKIDNFDPKELSKIQDNIDNTRYTCHLLESYKYMILFTLIIPNELHLIESFRHVIFINTIEKN